METPKQPTDPKILEDRIMNSNVPKSEAEWWAKKEIESLREKAKPSKAIDLYSIILDGFIEVLKLHGITEVSIRNDLTSYYADKCIEAISQPKLKDDINEIKMVKCENKIDDDLPEDYNEPIKNIGKIIKGASEQMGKAEKVLETIKKESEPPLPDASPQCFQRDCPAIWNNKCTSKSHHKCSVLEEEIIEEEGVVEDDPCPVCGTNLKAKTLGEGAGVECPNPKCDYWFCF